jgi:hypothetical protein
MRVIENATIIGRSFGDRNVIIVLNEATGEEISMVDLKGFDLELGSEGKISYLAGSVNHILQYESAIVEDLAA